MRINELMERGMKDTLHTRSNNMIRNRKIGILIVSLAVIVLPMFVIGCDKKEEGKAPEGYYTGPLKAKEKGAKAPSPQ